jgi:drug/metabolite transporter (DMT)-like permease
MKSPQFKWIILIVLALIWGSSFILIKKGLVSLNPFQLGSLRIIFCALFLLIIGFKNVATIPLHKWKYIALTSLFGTFIPAYLFAVAQTEINSSVSSILNSLTPLNTLILGAIVFGLDFKRTQIFGVIVGLIGTMLLIFNGAIHNPNQNYWYTILVLIASICYAMNVNFIKKYLSDLKPLTITVGNFLVMLFPALIVLSFTDFLSVVQVKEVQHAMIFVAILGIIGTGIANVLFYKLIQISSPVFATSVTYLIPVVAFFWGLLDNEMLTPVQFVGAFVVLVGVYLSSKK